MDRDGAAGVYGLVRRRGGFVGLRCCVEVLDEHLPRVGQRRRHHRHETFRAADVAVGVGVGADEVDDRLGIDQSLFGVDVPDDRQPVRKAGDELVKHGVEDDRRPVLVGAQHAHRASRRGERALDERQDRRHAASAAETQQRCGSIGQAEGACWPGDRHFDTLPPGTRLTVVASSESVSGALDIE